MNSTCPPLFFLLFQALLSPYNHPGLNLPRDIALPRIKLMGKLNYIIKWYIHGALGVEAEIVSKWKAFWCSLNRYILIVTSSTGNECVTLYILKRKGALDFIHAFMQSELTKGSRDAINEMKFLWNMPQSSMICLTC